MLVCVYDVWGMMRVGMCTMQAGAKGKKVEHLKVRLVKGRKSKREETREGFK